MKSLRKILVPVLQAVGTVALVGWILVRNDGSAVVQHLGSVRWEWVAAAFATMALSLLLGAWQWERLLAVQRIVTPFGRLFHAYSLGMFLNFVLPSGVGGDFVRALAIERETRAGTRGVAATLLDRFAGLFTLAILAFLASLLLVNGEHDALFEKLALLTGLAALGFCVVAVVLFSRRILGWFAPLAGLLGEGRLLSTARGLREAFLEYRLDPRPVLEVLGLSIVVQFLRILVHVFCAMALGLRIEFAWFLLFVPIVSLVSVLPISVGGWGLREGTQKTLFALPGVMAGVAPSAAPSLALAQALMASLVGMLAPAVVSAVAGILISARPSTAPAATGQGRTP